MMKLHYINEYQEVDIPEIIWQICEMRAYEDIKDMFNSNHWHSMLINLIDEAIILYLDLNETTRLENTFSEKDLANLREEVIDRLRYMFK